MRHLVTLSALFLLLIPASRSWSLEDSTPGLAELVKAYLEAPGPLEARRARLTLLESELASAEALSELARKEEKPERAEKLEEVARQALATHIEKDIREKLETGLVFDGQYDHLKKLPGSLDALHTLVEGETVDLPVRLGAINALADVADRGYKPRLENLVEDPFLYPVIREQLGLLLAILGDTRKIDRDIEQLEQHVESSNPDLALGANLQLANLSYRIRRYETTIACYHRVLKIYELVRTRFPANHPLVVSNFNDSSLSLQHYNLSCSYSLSGKIEKAREHLKTAVLLDPIHYKNMSIDGDLKNLREAEGHEEFRRGINRALQEEDI